MKKIILFLSTVFLGGNLFSQTLEQNIQEIRTQFKWINSQRDFQKVVFENEEFTDQLSSEGCELVVYYKNGNLYKMIETDAASVNLYTTEYYFKNNQLIFVFRKEDEFTRIPGEGVVDTETIYEERTYYKDGNIIRHLEKGNSLLDKPLDYQELSNEYKKYYNTKVTYEKQYILLQGIWINSADDDWYEIQGLRAEYWYQADPVKTVRFWFDGQYLWFHTTSYPEEDRKYELLTLTEKKLEVQDRASGDVLIFEKKQD